MSGKRKLSLYLKLLIPLIILTGLYIFYRLGKHEFLQSGLQKMVENKTDSLYKISYDSISVDEAAGNLYIKNLYIKGDTARQMLLIRRGDTNASKVILNIYIPLLKVVGFKTAGALLSKQLVCSEILIENAKANIYIFPGQAQYKDETIQRQELYKQILGNLKLIQADNVVINNSEVIAKNYFTNELKFNTFHTNIALHDVLVDSNYHEDTSRTLFCKTIKINSDKVILGEKNNSAQITGLVFNTISKVVFISRFDYDAFKNNGFFKTSLNDISVNGIEWKGPAESSDLKIKNIVFKRGDIQTLTGNGSNKSSTSNTNDRILSGWIKTFWLGGLNIQSFTLTSTTHDKKKPPVSIKNNAMVIKNLRLDTLSRLNESLVNNVGEVEFNNDNLTIISDDKFYAYKISGFRVNTKAKKVWIKQVACVPRFSEEEFAKKSKFQTDRYDVSFNNIECSNVNVSKLLQGSLYASTVTSRNSSLKVYRDLSYPSTGESNFGTYPHQLLFKLKIPVNIGRFTAFNTYVAYKEKNSLTDTSGTVTFNNSNITITNICNLSPKAGDKATVVFSANLLNSIPLKGSLSFDLNEWQKGIFKADATVNKSFDADIFNQLTQPMSLIKINSGVFDYISFGFVADNYIAKGKLTMTYHNFKVSLLKKKGEELHKKNISSIVANAFIKNNNNPGGKMRIANIEMQRNPKRSFFNFIWVSIFSGGQKIFGIPVKK